MFPALAAFKVRLLRNLLNQIVACPSTALKATNADREAAHEK